MKLDVKFDAVRERELQLGNGTSDAVRDILQFTIYRKCDFTAVMGDDSTPEIRSQCYLRSRVSGLLVEKIRDRRQGIIHVVEKLDRAGRTICTEEYMKGFDAKFEVEQYRKVASRLRLKFHPDKADSLDFLGNKEEMLKLNGRYFDQDYCSQRKQIVHELFTWYEHHIARWGLLAKETSKPFDDTWEK